MPTLSSVGASLALPCFRFHTPLIEPDVRICRIRLSEKTHAIAIAIARDAVCNFWKQFGSCQACRQSPFPSSLLASAFNWSGRTVARSGLRMMPTFPPSPLSFRTAGFPQYGWKVGLSSSAFPNVAQVKPAPGMPCATRRFASTLRALRCPTLRPALRRNSGLGGALPFEESTPLRQRSSLLAGFYCPSPSTLNRPHPPHSQAHPDFAA